MRVFKIFAVCVLSTFPLLGWAGRHFDTDIRPGSRSIYVGNHIPNQVPDFIHVFIRECECPGKKDHPLPTRAQHFFCKCWANFSDEDQPAVQGNPLLILTQFNAFGRFLPGFGVDHVPQSGETYLIIPSPKMMMKVFEMLDMDQYFELVAGATTVDLDRYLTLLSRGKIPLASVPNDKEVKDIRFLYHSYFHDLLNHSFLWGAFPDQLRYLVSIRAGKLEEIFKYISSAYHSEPRVEDYLTLMKFMAVVKFDTAMGSLNNEIFSEIESVVLETGEKTNKKLERTVNFGLKARNQDSDFAKTLFDINQFLALWFDTINSTVIENLAIAKLKGIHHFDSFEAIQKEPQVLASLERLLTLSNPETEAIGTKILEIVNQSIQVKSRPPSLTDRLITIQSFYHDVKARIRESFKRYEKLKNELNTGFNNF